MLCQQLRALAFMAIAVAHLSEAAEFHCDNVDRYVSCQVTLNEGNKFDVKRERGCSNDGRYCVSIKASSSGNWKFNVVNDGVECSGECSPQKTDGNSDYCKVNIC